MRGLLSASLTVCLAGSAFADTQYWVAVGSYQDVAYAQEALDRANADLRESFSLTSLDIAGEHWYRVISGPYLSLGVAELTIVEAQQAGFESAWMLVIQDDEAAGVEDDYSAYDGTTYDDYRAYDDYEPYDGDYEAYEDGSAELPRDDAEGVTVGDVREREKVEHELVEEAPAGYGLHKLRRDGG